MTQLDAFLCEIADFTGPRLFNPLRDQCEFDADENAPKRRRERLRRFLTRTTPKLLLCGEAPGYQGARYTALAFTSERQVLAGVIPGLAAERARITTRTLPMSEPSATIVWGALNDFGVADAAITWNAIVAHPMDDGPHTNRTPTSAERSAGLHYLEKFLRLFPNVVTCALGRTAEASLAEVGHRAHALRHPANGGATKFRNGLQLVLREHALYRPPQATLGIE